MTVNKFVHIKDAIKHSVAVQPQLEASQDTLMQINKTQVAQRFAQATQSYAEHAQIQAQMSQHLWQLMQQYLPQQHWRCLEIGCGTGHLSRHLIHNLSLEEMVLNDIYPAVQQHFDHIAPKERLQWLIGDIETVAWPKSLNLIASSSVLQWMHNLDAVLQQAKHSLAVDGYLCFSSFGPDNLLEIKQLTGHGLQYWDLQHWRKQLDQHGFEVLELSEQIHDVDFAHPKQVLKHLQATGVTATAQSHRWSKASLQQFYADYQQQFSRVSEQGDRNYSLRYHPIYGIARRRK